MPTIAWLKELQGSLWPEDKRDQWQGVVWVDAYRELTKTEWAKVQEAIAEHKLVCEMFSASMFGAYGMSLYEHPAYPGLPAEHILRLVEGHLPGPTRQDALMGRHESRPARKTPGSGLDDAWEAFSAYTHSEVNRGWLARYGLREPKSRGSYDY